ncbi:MAG TPA: hypothetical protein PLF16_01195 [Candidatus Staskawiczbacteria bacterium]|nr:hypothetical protein [Candidatus Staskawiczbacteria bacterium]
MKFAKSLSVVCLAAIVIASLCGCGSKTNVFPVQVMKDAIKAETPAFIQLSDVQVEPVIGPDGKGKVNFKVEFAAKEDLYKVDRKVEGDPPFTLLKLVRRSGDKAVGYGVADVSRIVDLWKVESVTMQSGSPEFGFPLGTFGPDHYAADSKEAKEALKLQADNARAAEQKKKDALAEQERQAEEAKAKIAKLQEEEAQRQKQERLRQEQRRLEQEKERQLAQERHQQELQEQRQKLLQATSPGAKYSGTISNNQGQQESILMQVKSRNDSSIQVVFSSPNGRAKRIFEGEIVFEPKAEIRLKSTDDVSPPPNAPRRFERGSSGYFYFGKTYAANIRFTLTLTDEGTIEGTGNLYKVSLSKSTTLASVAKVGHE